MNLVISIAKKITFIIVFSYFTGKVVESFLHFERKEGSIHSLNKFKTLGPKKLVVFDDFDWQSSSIIGFTVNVD